MSKQGVIPKNDMGTFVAVVFVGVAVSKVIDIVKGAVRRKLENSKEKKDAVWKFREDELPDIAASGQALDDEQSPEEPDYSFWQVSRAMEKKAIKESHERQYAQAKMTFYAQGPANR